MSTPPAESEAKGLSQAAFARLMNVSGPAVGKAIASKRLLASVGRDAKGRPYIADVELAKEEWTKNAGRLTRGNRSSSLAAAQQRLSEEKRRGLKATNDARLKLSTPTAVSVKEGFECARTIRDNMLNITPRVAAEFAAETDERKIFARLDEEIRKALASVARLIEEGERQKKAS